MTGPSYRSAGVNLDAATQARDLFKPHVRSTFGPQVLGDVGLFAGLFQLQGYKEPVLAASTDSVGTKLLLGQQMGRLDTLGHDIVNHCVNDVLTTGARPLFFLDYIAVEHLVPEQAEQLVKGISEACVQAGCALLGGETAQLPGIYSKDAFDLAGFLVGVAERDAILDPSSIKEGDALVALPSSGLHTNGYSLVRSVFGLDDDPSPLHEHPPELDCTLGDALLEPHRPYWPLLEHVLPMLKAMAHITGGGLADNLARVMPDGLRGGIDNTSWEVPAIYRLIQEKGSISDDEMASVFNMGVGMVLVCPQDRVAQVRSLLPEAWLLGGVTTSHS